MTSLVTHLKTRSLQRVGDVCVCQFPIVCVSSETVSGVGEVWKRGRDPW